jgi:hypothetical protein
VAQRVRRDALALVDPGRRGVAAKRERHVRGRQAPAVHAKEQRLLAALRAHGLIRDEQRHEAGVDRHDALAPALRVAHTDQPAVEIDVIDVEAEQL